MNNIDKVRILANTCSVYVEDGDCEGIRISHADDDGQCFFGIGEESDNEYRIEYTEVDLNSAIFYSLVQTTIDDEDGNTKLVQ